MAIAPSILKATVMHARQRPKPNRFSYRVYYLLFPLRSWVQLKQFALVSLERFNLFSLRAADYGRGKGPEQWIREVLAERGIAHADGDIVLLTMPRVLGYAFNPVSFWFCLDASGALRAVLADVTNTFRERHAYLMHHSDYRPITRDDWLHSRKVFHVSPFIEVSGHYAFRFAYSDSTIGVWINHHDDEGVLLTTSVAGRIIPLSSWALLGCFLRIPLVTVQVIALIHFQAIKLFLKGIRYHRKPLPPSVEISS